MTCDVDVKIPALFDPLSESGQDLLKKLGLGASGLQEAFDRYAKELSKNLEPLEKRLSDAADIFKKHYQDSADRAYKWLNESSARGPVAEAYVNKLAQSYVAQAQAISNNAVSAAQRLENATASNKATLDRLAPSVLSKIGTAADAAQLIDSISRGDTNGFMENIGQMAAMAAAAAAVAAAVAGIAAAAAVATPAALAAIAAAAGAVAVGYFGDAAFKKFGELTGPWLRAIGEALGEAAAKAAMEVFCDNKSFRGGLNWRRPSDPLTLNLDGDGIELTAASNSVLFDHNADNIRTGTQWVKPDDGILVRDLNGNGLIDSGKELFGDQTELPPGFGSAVLGSGGSGTGQGTLGTGLGGPRLAANGWQALSALDTNNDGIINSSDAAFAELKVWRDLNQDGISQANELQTLSQAGVASIKLPTNAANAANGTSAAGSTYTNSSGTTRTAQNIDFATNNFYSEFTDNPTVTASAALLPQLQGAGFVRDLREAMSLGTAKEALLQGKVASLKAASTAQERQVLLDEELNEVKPQANRYEVRSCLRPYLFGYRVIRCSIRPLWHCRNTRTAASSKACCFLTVS